MVAIGHLPDRTTVFISGACPMAVVIMPLGQGLKISVPLKHVECPQGMKVALGHFSSLTSVNY